MMVPGSQARLFLGGAFTLNSLVIFRFERMEIRPRAPRIPGTNSEGLPGAVRGNAWVAANMSLFKRYPHVSNLPGVGEWEVRVTQAHWDYDQVIYQVPSVNPIIPQRYVGMMCRPHFGMVQPQFSYVAPCMYVEEASHVIEVMRGQPVDFTMYSNGPFQFPQTSVGSIAPSVFPIIAA